MQETGSQQVRFHRTRWLTGFATLAAGIFISVVHWFQFDWLAPVTLIPPWLWLIPAIVGLAVCSSAATTSVKSLILIVWICFTALFVEEAASTFRQIAGVQKEPSAKSIRIATLNCCFGSTDAIYEIAAHSPDVIFLQESPGDTFVAKLCAELLGDESGWISCGDPSIMAKGSVEPVLVDPQSHFAHAVVTNPNGFQFDVVSLRLSPPVFRMDFWDQRFWRDHNKTRKNHRNQLQQIMDHLDSNAKTDHLIIGGDFNLVGGDGALKALTQKYQLRDTFHEAGVGWCNTGTSEYPLFRVDQIWINKNFSTLSNQTIATKHSDHRMVVADIEAMND